MSTHTPDAIETSGTPNRTGSTDASATEVIDADAAANIETIDGTVEFASTPASEIRQRHNADEVSLEAWAAHHDVCDWMLPFNSRSFDPIAVGKRIAEGVSGLVETAETFTRREFDVADEPVMVVDPFLYAHGVTVFDTGGNRTQYRNPDYLHYDTRTTPLEDTDERLSFYNRYASIGTVDIAWFARHFDMSASECEAFLSQHTDTPPQQRLAASQLRLGKTAFTAVAWGVAEQSDIATALGLSDATLERYIERAADAEWQPPYRPDEESWFGPTKAAHL